MTESDLSCLKRVDDMTLDIACLEVKGTKNALEVRDCVILFRVDW
jgi:hypothetical protein